MTVGEVLRAAAQRVRQGWVQRQLRDGFGGVCAIGAIDEVCLMSCPRTNVSARQALSDTLGLTRGPNDADAGIAAWNDAPGQTQENVATAMELAAVVWEAKQRVKKAGVEDAALVA